MAIITYPLNGVTYDATDVETYLCSRTSGVFDDDASFAISLLGGRSISISKGLAWIRNEEFAGKSICNKEPVTLSFDIADGSLNRYDRVVLRFDKVASRSTIAIVKGTSASTPTPPNITRNSNIYELGLYLVYIPAGSINLALQNVTDTRADLDVCGRVADGVTGQAELLELVRNAVDAVNKLTHVSNVTLPVSGWSSTAPYTQTVQLIGTTAESFPDWYVAGEPSEDEFESFSFITSLTTSENTLTFKCAADKPKVNVHIMLKGI